MAGSDQRLKRKNETGSEKNREYEINRIFASLPVDLGYSLPSQSILDIKKLADLYILITLLTKLLSMA
jgi:hypothetical protein